MSSIFMRRGKFYLDDSFIATNPEMAMKIMSNVIVYRAEFYHDRRAIEYFAYSSLFDAIAPGLMPPVYNVYIDENNNVVAETRGW